MEGVRVSAEFSDIVSHAWKGIHSWISCTTPLELELKRNVCLAERYFFHTISSPQYDDTQYKTSDNFFTSSCRWINRFSYRCSTTFFHCCCCCCCCLVLCKNLVSTLLQFPITPTEMEKKVLMTVFISIVQTLLDMLRVNCRYMIFYRMTCFRLQVATTFAFLWYYLPRFLLCFGGNFSNVTSNLQLPTAPANC